MDSTVFSPSRLSNYTPKRGLGKELRNEQGFSSTLHKRSNSEIDDSDSHNIVLEKIRAKVAKPVKRRRTTTQALKYYKSGYGFEPIREE